MIIIQTRGLRTDSKKDGWRKCKQQTFTDLISKGYKFCYAYLEEEDDSKTIIVMSRDGYIDEFRMVSK